MPIINEVFRANIGPDVFASRLHNGCGLGPNRVPAVVNVGGNAVSGFSVRFTTIDEVAAQETGMGAVAMEPLLGFDGFPGAYNRFSRGRR